MAAEVDITARRILANMLAAGHTQMASATAAGYSRKHVQDLLKDPTFQNEIERARQAGVKQEVASRAPRNPVKQHVKVMELEPATTKEEIEEARMFLRRVVAGQEKDDDGCLKLRIQAARAILTMPGRVIAASLPQPVQTPTPAPLPARLCPITSIDKVAEEASKWLKANS